MDIRRFEINVRCASCVGKVDKVFKQYPDIKYSLNLLEKMLSVEADENKYSDQFIIDLVAKIGYVVERI